MTDKSLATESLQASIDSIKAELGNGRLAIRGRRSGKTAALLEWVHEHNPGNTIVVCCNEITRDMVRCRYREMFPQDAQPLAVSIHRVSDKDVLGTNRKWSTDEVWPAAVVRKARSYARAEYVGGVGTPMCMDCFSGGWLTGEEGERPESPKPVFMQVSKGNGARG